MRLFYPSSTTGSNGISIKTTKGAANNLDILYQTLNTGTEKTINSLRIIKQHQRSDY